MQVAGPQVNITYENLLFHVGSGPCAEYDLLTGEMFFENGAEGFSSVLRGDIFQISVPSFSWVDGRRTIYRAHFLANISIILSQMQIISLETVPRRKYVHSSAPENLWHWRKKLRNDGLATMYSTLSSHFTSESCHSKDLVFLFPTIVLMIQTTFALSLSVFKF